MGDVFQYLIDGTSGIVTGGVDGKALVAGVCSKGQVGKGYLVGKTIDEVRASVFANVEKVQDEFVAKGWLPLRLNLNKGVVRGLLEIYCWGYWQIYALLQRLMKQAVPATSTGDWLNTHAASVNLSRRPATNARGNVRSFRLSGRQREYPGQTHRPHASGRHRPGVPLQYPGRCRPPRRSGVCGRAL